jgi:hypothetical protein
VGVETNVAVPRTCTELPLPSRSAARTTVDPEPRPVFSAAHVTASAAYAVPVMPVVIASVPAAVAAAAQRRTRVLLWNSEPADRMCLPVVA